MAINFVREYKIGNGCSSAKSGKTLTVNPKLLEKMQNGPGQAKETKELIRGVESAMNLGGWFFFWLRPEDPRYEMNKSCYSHVINQGQCGVNQPT